MRLFGRDRSSLCRIYLHTLFAIYERHAHRVNWWPGLTPARIAHYAAHVQQRGCPLAGCWGFVDGTGRPIARPTHYQRAMYSGHKRLHVAKYQGITTPDGLIVSMAGPYAGRHNDNFMLNDHGTDARCAALCGCHPGADRTLCRFLYCDGGYGVRSHIIAPIGGGAGADAARQLLNRTMSGLRIAVEWSFGDILEQFSKLDFKRKNKTLLSPVGTEYLVATLLINCFICLYGGMTSVYFSCQPPALDDYLQ